MTEPMTEMNRPVLLDVVVEHVEEAAFLWLLRDLAVGRPHYALARLADLDDRLEAHVDGLRVAGEPGWEIAKEQLVAIGEPGEVFAAAVLAFEGGDPAKVQAVLAAGTAQPEAVRGLVSALGWLTYEQAAKPIKPLLAATDPVLKRVGIAASAIHRRNPGPALSEAFAAADPLLKARALRAAGELGLVDLHIALRSHLKAKDPTCRFWAAWSNALLNGHLDAVAELQAIAEADGPFSERSVRMALRRLPPREARIWIKKLIRELGRLRVAAIGAGALADPEIIPWLIDQMKVPALARVAGESFSLITGVHIAHDKLEGPTPEGFEAGPTEDPDDENVAMDPDENLPWPDPVLVRKWWEARRGGFSKDTRYLLGQPITVESIRQALQAGYQRQRAAAAIELALLKPGRPLFEVRAPGHRQQQILAGAASSPGR
jgi:uncharacterized protein (TIGR02270 family)